MLSRRSPMWLACVLAVATAGCGATSINQVLADPARYRNQTITVRGSVSDSATILGRGAYRIADGDLGLWVVTTGGAPRKGARVEVTGRLQEGYDLSAFGGIVKLPSSIQNALVLVESSHKARD